MEKHHCIVCSILAASDGIIQRVFSVVIAIYEYHSPSSSVRFFTLPPTSFVVVHLPIHALSEGWIQDVIELHCWCWPNVKSPPKLAILEDHEWVAVLPHQAELLQERSVLLTSPRENQSLKQACQLLKVMHWKGYGLHLSSRNHILENFCQHTTCKVRRVPNQLTCGWYSYERADL